MLCGVLLYVFFCRVGVVLWLYRNAQICDDLHATNTVNSLTNLASNRKSKPLDENRDREWWQVCCGGTGARRAVDVHLQDHREPEARQGERPQEGRCRLLRRRRCRHHAGRAGGDQLRTQQARECPPRCRQLAIFIGVVGVAGVAENCSMFIALRAADGWDGLVSTALLER